MLRSYLLVAGMAAIALASAACGDSGNTGAGGSGGGTGGGATTGSGAGGPGIQPPAPPAEKPADGMGTTVFAVSKLYLGDTDRSGAPNKVNGWKQYGYDLDGTISTEKSTNLCKPRNNAAPKTVYPDGNDGIDNSFGKNILGIILGIASDAPQKVNESIAEGKFTLMLSLEKLGAEAEYNPIVAKLYGGADLGAAPKWDGSDKWPLIPELLENPADPASAKVQFQKSYLVNNTWVSGTKGDVKLSLGVSGYTLNLTIASAIISMQLDADHKTVTNGTIAGVLKTDTLTSELKKVAGGFDPSLCSGPTIDSIVAQLEQASDIMSDGSQDPSATCDGISIGLGFDGSLVQIGDVAPAAEPQPDPCAP